MRVLGISGLFATDTSDYPHTAPIGFFHDSAAALVVDGRAVAAVEEERLSREKHTNRFPSRAARACLTEGGLSVANLDAVAYFFDEEFTDRELALEGLKDAGLPVLSSRKLICDRLEEEFGERLPANRIQFVRHHEAHAVLASIDSGFDRSLVLVIDGNGETEGISVFDGQGPDVTLLRAYARDDSLGHFCTEVTKFLGFRAFDEYKVMGLAPYGRASRFREPLSELVTLGPDGEYTLDVPQLSQTLLDAGLVPRRADEDPLGVYADVAAAAQELTEEVVEHVVRFWQAQSGLRRLCIVGGVAQNTSLNGRLLTLGCFDEVFVHPASHDAGTALGAAYTVDHSSSASPRRSTRRRGSPYLGPDLGSHASLERELRTWEPMLRWSAPDDLSDATARLLAEGEVVGWAQGRSEFGPRALGHRSILADPREASMRDYVNALIKRREPFRPLAPSVLEERAGELFELPETPADYRYMSFVVRVRREWEARLGAVTHSDGTARIQTVGEADEPLYRRLLAAFCRRTGVPALLNTSFNNQAEPIVQSARDVIRCFLTTDLRYVALGAFLVEKADFSPALLKGFGIVVRSFGALQEVTEDAGVERSIVRRGAPGARREVSPTVASIVKRAIAEPGISTTDMGLQSLDEDVERELFALWQARLIDLEPKAA
jgi:predicted NodU family carbamoyl transferase